MSATTRRAVLRGSLAAGAAAALPAPAVLAATPRVRIGVLSDMSGPYADNSGPGGVVAVQLAIEDFMKTDPGFTVDVVSADMLDKPDVGATIARGWYDRDGVDVILDVPQSAVALAVGSIAREKNKLAVFTGAALPSLTGKYCTPNTIQWTYDLWALCNGTARTLLGEHDRDWFIVIPDYVSGHATADIVTGLVQQAGGTVKGSVSYPFPGTTDFSNFLVQAKASGAKVVCLANSGADTVNCLKQAREFGLPQGGQVLTAIVFSIQVVHSVGLPTAQGLVVTESFYWDMNEGTRAFSARFQPLYKNFKPSLFHAGSYSAATHFMKAVKAMGVERAKASGAAICAEMKAIPTDDPLFGRGYVRADGKFIHPMYVFQVKTPAESRYPWDYYNLLRTIPADQAFQTMAELGCPLITADGTMKQ